MGLHSHNDIHSCQLLKDLNSNTNKNPINKLLSQEITSIVHTSELSSTSVRLATPTTTP